MSTDLPHELVRRILLQAAQASTSSCRALCEVSTWVRHLALPILYTTVSLNHLTLEPFARVVTSPSVVCPPNLHFTPPMPHCKKATHFAFTRIGLSALSSAVDPSVISPEEAEAGIREGDVDMGEGALHVTLLYNGSHGGWELFDESLMFRPHQPLYSRLRRIDGGLRQQIDDWVYKAHTQDARIHAVTPLFDDLHEEWDVEVHGGVTIWEKAIDYTQQLMSRT
ncbi:hypothetical protein BD779DRAFT_1673590 [Infundibulicybe gibba]|nr:hypothetical protein BD779DRAFT_1673590 [Infundibulicybe gibba]